MVYMIYDIEYMVHGTSYMLLWTQFAKASMENALLLILTIRYARCQQILIPTVDNFCGSHIYIYIHIYIHTCLFVHLFICAYIIKAQIEKLEEKLN